MVHLQAPDYSVPWADADFIDEFGPIEGRKCYQIMHGREKPCEKCPTFQAFKTKEAVISEWHRDEDHTYMTVVEPLPNDLPLLVEFMTELKLPDSRGKGPGLLLRIKEGWRNRSNPLH